LGRKKERHLEREKKKKKEKYTMEKSMDDI
jgi:hypothetical protein